jgi:hypothetical protein
VGKPEGKHSLGDPGLDGRIKLRWIFTGSGIWGYGLDRDGSGQVAGTCECGNEPSGSIKWEFLD